jgi:hypothetical protein
MGFGAPLAVPVRGHVRTLSCFDDAFSGGRIMEFSEHPLTGSDAFIVAFEGRLVECVSLDDAIAIKQSGAILSQGAPHDFSAAELNRLAGVLARYGKEKSAERISQLASYARAMRFLAGHWQFGAQS